jgi:hypothetical protein
MKILPTSQLIDSPHKHPLISHSDTLPPLIVVHHQWFVYFIQHHVMSSCYLSSFISLQRFPHPFCSIIRYTALVSLISVDFLDPITSQPLLTAHLASGGRLIQKAKDRVRQRHPLASTETSVLNFTVSLLSDNSKELERLHSDVPKARPSLSFALTNSNDDLCNRCGSCDICPNCCSVCGESYCLPCSDIPLVRNGCLGNVPHTFYSAITLPTQKNIHIQTNAYSQPMIGESLSKQNEQLPSFMSSCSLPPSSISTIPHTDQQHPSNSFTTSPYMNKRSPSVPSRRISQPESTTPPNSPTPFSTFLPTCSNPTLPLQVKENTILPEQNLQVHTNLNGPVLSTQNNSTLEQLESKIQSSPRQISEFPKSLPTFQKRLPVASNILSPTPNFKEIPNQKQTRNLTPPLPFSAISLHRSDPNEWKTFSLLPKYTVDVSLTSQLQKSDPILSPESQFWNDKTDHDNWPSELSSIVVNCDTSPRSPKRTLTSCENNITVTPPPNTSNDLQSYKTKGCNMDEYIYQRRSASPSTSSPIIKTMTTTNIEDTIDQDFFKHRKLDVTDSDPMTSILGSDISLIPSPVMNRPIRPGCFDCDRRFLK